MLTKENLEKIISDYDLSEEIKVKKNCEGKLIMEVTYETAYCNLLFTLISILADAEYYYLHYGALDWGTVDFSEKGIIRITLPA